MPYFLGPSVSVPLKPDTVKPEMLKPGTGSKRRGSSKVATRRYAQRTSSLGGWIRNILPSHRAERGGTAREQGFWEKQGAGQQSRRVMTESHQSLASEACGSDHITRWNMAQEVPQSRMARQQHQAEQSNRKWSWVATPKLEANDAMAAAGALAAAAGALKTNAVLETNEAHATDEGGSDSQLVSTIERRLAQTRQMIEAKKEARQQRRNLKASGDYLGVQGINPATGQLDVTTPTDSSLESGSGSGTSHETQQKLQVLRNALRDARHSYRQAKQREGEVASKIELESETHKLRRLKQGKQRRNQVTQRVRWRRQTKQWSSAQEPGLSPIAQSRVESRRQSRNKDAMPQPEPLVDVSSPDLPSLPLGHLSRKADVGSHSSTATVVRTPQRSSLAIATPSAWELFENGISFNTSESSQAGGVPVAASKPAPPTPPKSARHGPNASCPTSFLGERSPGGKALQWPAMTPSKPQHASHASPRGTPPHVRDKPERRLSMPRPGDAQPMARGSLRRLVPPWSDPRAAKTSTGRSSHHLAEEQQVSLVALKSLRHLEHRGKGDEHPASNTHLALLRPAVPTRRQPGRSAVNADFSLAVPKTRIETRIETRQQGDVDMEWIETVIRDMTKRSMELQDEYASTRITTTTGSDRLMSPSRQVARHPEADGLVARKQRLDRTPCSEPRSSLPRPATQGRGTATSPLASVWPKPQLTGAPSAAANDTTLVKQPATPTNQRARPPAVVVSITASTSPKSMSTPQADSHGSMADGKLEALDTVVGMMPKSAADCTNDAEVPTTPSASISDGGNEGLVVPGAYPVDAADLSGKMQDRSGWDAAESGERLGTSSITSITSTRALSQAAERLVYLSVLDSGSEYWMRNARRDVAMVLALPVAMLAAAMLV